MKFSPKLAKEYDPDGGFLLFSSLWRPNPDDPDPEMPGLKQMMISYLALQPQDACLCGSGQKYAACCQPKPVWQPICNDPDLEGFSFMAPQQAVFKQVDAPRLKQCLQDDLRLAMVEDTADGGFWIHWGDPGFETELGVICFGDLELQAGGVLLVTATSDTQMQTILNLLQEIAGDCLDTPELSKDPAPQLQKRRKGSRKKRRWKLRGRN